MFKKNSTKWTVHMKALQSAKERQQSVGLQLADAKQALDAARSGAIYSVKNIARKINHLLAREPLDDLDAIIDKLRAVITEVPVGQISLGQKRRVQAWEKQLAELESRADKLNEAVAYVGRQEDFKAEAAATLEDVKSRQPKPTEADLAAVTAERDKAREDVDRLATKLEAASRKLESLQANGPNTHRVDELAAEMALSEDGGGPSDAAIAAAQKELDMGQAEIQSQQSAVRGLDGLRAKAATTLEDLEALRCHVGEAVLGVKNKKSEEKFLEAVAAMEEALQELETDRRKLNAVLPSGMEYTPPQAKIKLPALYAVTDLPQPTTRLAILP